MALQNTNNEGEFGGLNEWIKKVGLTDNSVHKIIDNGVSIEMLLLLANETNKKDRDTMINELIQHLQLNIMDKLKFKQAILNMKSDNGNDDPNDSNKIIVLLTKEENDASQSLSDNFRKTTQEMTDIQNMILKLNETHGNALKELNDATNNAINKINERKKELQNDLDNILHNKRDILTKKLNEFKQHGDMLSKTKNTYEHNLKNTELDQDIRKQMNVDMITKAINTKPTNDLNVNTGMFIKINPNDILVGLNKWNVKSVELSAPVFKVKPLNDHAIVIVTDMDGRADKIEITYNEDNETKQNCKQCMIFSKDKSNKYIIFGLEPDNAYTIQVRCVGESICSDYSNAIAFKTLPENRLIWNQTQHGGKVIFIDDNTVKYGNQDAIVVSKNVIKSEVYRSFEWKVIIHKCSFFSWIGFIGGSIEECIFNWKTCLCGSSNKNTHYVSAFYYNDSNCPNVNSGDYITFDVDFETQKGTAVYKNKIVKRFNNFGNQIIIAASNNTNDNEYNAQYTIEFVSCIYVE